VIKTFFEIGKYTFRIWQLVYDSIFLDTLFLNIKKSVQIEHMFSSNIVLTL